MESQVQRRTLGSILTRIVAKICEKPSSRCLKKEQEINYFKIASDRGTKLKECSMAKTRII